MKLLIATGLYAPQIGGPATHTRMLEQHLPAHGIETVTVPFSRVAALPRVARHLAYTHALIQEARRADLIFAQDILSVGLPALVASTITRKPFIVRVPGDYAWEQARGKYGVVDSLEEFQVRRYGVTIEFLRLLSRLVVRHAHTTVVPSEYMRAIVTQWHPRRLAVIANGIDMPSVITPPSDPPPAPRIVTASRLIPGKGFEMLIDLMKELPEWHLVIVGDGPLMGALAKRAEQSGQGARITFTGSATPEEMFGWYKTATVFVLNTSFETFSFQVLEALASGTPTIATAVGAIPEILEHDVEGVLVPAHHRSELKAAIESVVAEPVRWGERVANGKRKAHEFSGAALGRRFADLFSGVILGLRS